jgi:hypothetical protein
MKRVVQLNRLKYTKACHRDKPFLILHSMKQAKNNFKSTTTERLLKIFNKRTGTASGCTRSQFYN